MTHLPVAEGAFPHRLHLPSVPAMLSHSSTVTTSQLKSVTDTPALLTRFLLKHVLGHRISYWKAGGVGVGDAVTHFILVTKTRYFKHTLPCFCRQQQCRHLQNWVFTGIWRHVIAAFLYFMPQHSLLPTKTLVAWMTSHMEA